MAMVVLLSQDVNPGTGRRTSIRCARYPPPAHSYVYCPSQVQPCFARRHADLLPSLGIVLASIGWGLFWLPLRAVEADGVSGPWATVAVFAPAVIAMAPFMARRLARYRRRDATVLITGLFTGGAWVLYSNSLLYTDVVRALLLFYLTPLWSTLLGRLVLGEPITPPRLLTIVMGIAGLVVILGFKGAFPVPHNLGDWLGLVSGMVWAGASVRLRREGASPLPDALFSYFLGGSLLALGAAALTLAPPMTAQVVAGMPVMFAISVGFILPSMWLIIYGSQRLSPGRVGILLMVEAVVGAASAALLTDEPFGAREAIGGALVIAAGVVDILWAGGSRNDLDPKAHTH